MVILHRFAAGDALFLYFKNFVWGPQWSESPGNWVLVWSGPKGPGNKFLSLFDDKRPSCTPKPVRTPKNQWRAIFWGFLKKPIFYFPKTRWTTPGGRNRLENEFCAIWDLYFKKINIYEISIKNEEIISSPVFCHFRFWENRGPLRDLPTSRFAIFLET